MNGRRHDFLAIVVIASVNNGAKMPPAGMMEIKLLLLRLWRSDGLSFLVSLLHDAGAVKYSDNG